MPAPMIAATHSPAASAESKPNSTGRAPSAARSSRTVASVTMPSWPSEPTIEPEQIEPAGIEMRAAEFDDVAVERDERDAQNVIGRHAIFEAMRAARIHPDVAADGAGELRGRVGSVKEPVGSDRLGNRQIGDAGLRRGRSGRRG